MRPRLTLTAAACRAVIPGMDGVVTDTAHGHARAWKRRRDEYPERRAVRRGEPFRPCDLDADDRRVVDGKAREDGVRSSSRRAGSGSRRGVPGIPRIGETVHDLGTRKNEPFLDRVRADGVGPITPLLSRGGAMVARARGQERRSDEWPRSS